MKLTVRHLVIAIIAITIIGAISLRIKTMEQQPAQSSATAQTSMYTITCADGEKVLLPAFLAAQSPVLKAMFEGGFKEGTEKKAASHFDSDAMHRMINFLTNPNEEYLMLCPLGDFGANGIFSYYAIDIEPELLARVIIAKISSQEALQLFKETGMVDGTIINGFELIPSMNMRKLAETLKTLKSNLGISVWESKVLSGHTSQLESALWSPDGKKIVTASLDGTSRIWTFINGSWQSPENQILREHTGSVLSASWNHDGTHIVTTSENGTARIWTLMNGSWQSPENQILRGHLSWVMSAAWSPDDKNIITTSEDNTARIWTLVNGSWQSPENQILRGHLSWVMSAAWSPDSKKIVTASLDGTARVWTLVNGSWQSPENQILHCRTSGIGHAAWSPDGKNIITASSGTTARIWTPKNGSWQSPENQILRGHGAEITSAAWSPDSKSIVTASWDKTARIWTLVNGYWQSPENQILKGHGAEVMSAAWSPDSKSIVTASWDKTARVWTQRDFVGNENVVAKLMLLQLLKHGKDLPNLLHLQAIFATFDKTSQIYLSKKYDLSPAIEGSQPEPLGE